MTQRRPKPRRIGKYIVHDLIGSGGFSDVYSATDPALGCEVAIKVLKPDIAGQPRYIEKLIEEGRRTAGLRHDNIVRVLDADVDAGRAYIAMDHLRGDPLGEILKDKPARETLFRRVLFEIGDALVYAHSKGIVHGDVKPQNIMINAASRPYLLDFGISQVLEDRFGRHFDATPTYTVRYASPEQLVDGYATRKSDQYSFAAVLYEMCTGAPAFEGNDKAKLTQSILEESPPPPSSHSTRITPELDRVLLRALASEPGDRFASVEELIDAVREALDAAPLAGPRPPKPDDQLDDGQARATTEPSPKPELPRPPQPEPPPPTRVSKSVVATMALAVAALIGTWFVIAQLDDTAKIEGKDKQPAEPDPVYQQPVSPTETTPAPAVPAAENRPREHESAVQTSTDLETNGEAREAPPQTTPLDYGFTVEFQTEWSGLDAQSTRVLDTALRETAQTWLSKHTQELDTGSLTAVSRFVLQLEIDAVAGEIERRDYDSKQVLPWTFSIRATVRDRETARQARGDAIERRALGRTPERPPVQALKRTLRRALEELETAGQWTWPLRPKRKV